MFARVVQVAGSAADIEAGIAIYRDQVLPYARDTTGFRGYIVLLDRDGGRAIAMSLWASAEAMLAYEERAERFRGLVAASSGTELDELQSYEVAMFELSG